MQWGSPEHGQLGSGTDGKRLEKAGKFTFDYVRAPFEVVAFNAKYPGTKAASVSCGANHTAVVDTEGRVYTVMAPQFPGLPSPFVKIRDPFPPLSIYGR